MRGFPMPGWKREVRRRVDDMLLMLRESRQVFGLRLEGEALDPADARRVWRTDNGPDGIQVRPPWASDLVLLHACRFKEGELEQILSEVDRFEAFIYEYLETKNVVARALLSLGFNEEVRFGPRTSRSTA